MIFTKMLAKCHCRFSTILYLCLKKGNFYPIFVCGDCRPGLSWQFLLWMNTLGFGNTLATLFCDHTYLVLRNSLMVHGNY